MPPLLALDDALSERAAEPAVKRVLVADDDAGVRGLLTALLEAEGVSVDVVASGREALARACDGNYDLVLLDVEMPGKTGLDVLAAIRERRLHTIVIITTAYGSEDIVAEALRRGADDYLRKPFERSDLQAVLDRTTARVLLLRQNAALRHRLEEHQRHLEEEVARAAQVVSELMPSSPPAIEGFEVAATCISSREVGGDFYDWQPLPSGELSLTVGDVMGKGLPAALLMASVRAALRAEVADHGPAEAVERTAGVIDHDLTRSGAFVTIFHARLQPRTGVLRFVDAGHGYVFLRRATGVVEELTPWGLPVGVDAHARYREGLVAFRPDDTLFIYSDGLGEARPDVFGDRARMSALIGEAPDASAVVSRILAEVADVRPLPDDLTVVVLRRTAPARA